MISPLVAIERGRSLQSAGYMTVGVGIVHAVLFLLSMLLLSTIPGITATDQEVLDFYASSDQRRTIIVGMYLMPFAGVAFLWFIVALRSWTEVAAARPLGQVFSMIQLVSGILFLALFLVAAAATSATAASVEFASAAVDPTVARILPGFGTTLLLVIAMRMAAIFVFSTSNIARETGVLPRWFVVAGYAVAVFLMLSISFSPVLVLAFPAWVLTLCLLLIRRIRHLSRDWTTVASTDRAAPGATHA